VNPEMVNVGEDVGIETVNGAKIQDKIKR